MPLFYFDIEDGGLCRDETGSEYRDAEAARHAAMRILPDVARYESLAGDRHTFTVIVRDAQQRPIFTTTLNLTGLWLVDRP